MRYPFCVAALKLLHDNELGIILLNCGEAVIALIRLDKYLKLSRLVKRRTVAQEMSEIGAVRINERVVKPSASVSDGDIIEIAYPRRILSVRVLTSDEVMLRRNAPAYEILNEKRADYDERPW